jgi:hypothetical protein
MNLAHHVVPGAPRLASDMGELIWHNMIAL